MPRSAAALLGPAIATFVVIAGSASSRAEPDEPCAQVEQALRSLAEAPRYHWTMTATTPGRRRPKEREQIVIDDIVYLTPDEGRWMKQRVPAAERVARLRSEMSERPPAQCRKQGIETRDSMAMQVYTYVQGDAEKQLWVGSADGLPHLYTSREPSVSVTMRVDYANVVAPLP